MEKKLPEYSLDVILFVDEEIWNNPDITPGEKLLFFLIDTMCRNNDCVYSPFHLAKFMHISRPTMSNWLKNLISKKLLFIEHRKNAKHIELVDTYIYTKNKYTAKVDPSLCVKHDQYNIKNYDR